jgi:hypothetical protein
MMGLRVLGSEPKIRDGSASSVDVRRAHSREHPSLWRDGYRHTGHVKSVTVACNRKLLNSRYTNVWVNECGALL